ncbi:hypothetical protein AQUCO_00200989v1 [Aquilegia coerulea]|uniref:Defensin-like protein n=1 Tax=Aquilegia coerulea TaxID=218851 RepID=A0A2G5F5P4_AQUCA|nr:hypothetical protein AQUCO_00200989v1 [Aquilegia coerulea]
MVSSKLIFFVVVLLVASGLPAMKVHVNAELKCFEDGICINDFNCDTNCLGCYGKCIMGKCNCVPKLGSSANPRPSMQVGKPCTNNGDCKELYCPHNSPRLSPICIDGYCSCRFF